MNTYRIVFYTDGFVSGGDYIQAPNHKAALAWAEMQATAQAQDGRSKTSADVICLGEDVKVDKGKYIQ